VSRRDRLGLGAVAVVVALAPLALTSQYHLSVGVFIGLHAIVTVGLCVLAGYAGQISLGQAAFYGIGAYASGVLTTRLGLDPWLAMGAAMALAALVAYAFGIPILKLHGHYLAMATLAFGIIVYLVFVELKDLTGGPSGLAGIPRLAVGGFVFDSDRKFFYLTWGAPLGALAVTLLAETIRDIVPRLLAHASGEHEVIAYGLLLIVIMIFMPQGLTAGGLRMLRRARGAT
jgi:branched-chain amino acid transport system permease protein